MLVFGIRAESTERKKFSIFGLSYGNRPAAARRAFAHRRQFTGIGIGWFHGTSSHESLQVFPEHP